MSSLTGNIETRQSLNGALELPIAATPNITVGETTTLIEGSKATVELDESSTRLNPVLNFGIPEGKKGESGVYVGETEPTNANVWIDPNGEPIIIPTKTSELTNDSGYVKNTDIATKTTAGVVKMWTSTNEDGELGLNISTEV